MKHTELFIDGTSDLSWLQSTTRCCGSFFFLMCMTNKKRLTVLPMMPAMPGFPLKPGKPWGQREKDTREVGE